MDNREKAKEMRFAIDMMEGSMMRWAGLLEMEEKCDLDESTLDELTLIVPVKWGQLRHVLEALSELTRIINSEEYVVK